MVPSAPEDEAGATRAAGADRLVGLPVFWSLERPAHAHGPCSWHDLGAQRTTLASRRSPPHAHHFLVSVCGVCGVCVCDGVYVRAVGVACVPWAGEVGRR